MSESGRREDGGSDPKKVGDGVVQQQQQQPTKQQQSVLDKEDAEYRRSYNKERRASSFTATNSPWFRRNSFLSTAMIENENFSVYESPSYYSQNASYNIISLKECQGFIFNQDLFASPYQQSRSLANEKRYRASFSHPTSGNSPSRRTSSRGSLSTKNFENSSCHSSQNESTPPPVPTVQPQRRHTSYLETRPTFLSTARNDSAIVDDENEVDEEETEDDYQIDNDAIDEAVDDIAMDILTDEEVEVDEYDEYEGMQYGGESANRGYKVHVTEIVVNESDNSMFPTQE
ncbi:hypothetical protein CLIB1423_04S01640 [[Candida] railenensis]|uniref:Uncharacterized protein n=1 Tax=[Candida] railenensis TaxID=45579 RepID=A0A9P0QMS5_9ASCO|nr:hypothetical protein CLIB1423_04S01640 [[Candida] railenensis]